MTTVRRVDVAVIGGGTAGMAARHQAEKCGASTLLIEASQFGTTCARVGCMPSKLLIAAAEAAHTVRSAGTFGVHVAPEAIQVNGRDVMRRVQQERDRFVGFVLGSIDRIPDDGKVLSRARFTGPTTLALDNGTLVEARSVVVATGSRPDVIPPLRDLGDRLLTTDSVFEMETLPASIAVVGAGVIGLELGQAFHRLGVRTTILDASPRLRLARDSAVVDTMHQVLGEELDLRMGIRDLQAQRHGRAVELRWHASDGQPETAEFEFVLAATGRRPNVDDLGLEHTGVTLDDRGIPEIDARTLQCGEHPIFLVGDANTRLPLLHEASDEGHVAGQNAAHFPDIRAGRRRVPLTIVFTDPQLAVVGTTGCDLSHTRHGVGEVSFFNQGRSRTMARHKGIGRVYMELDTGTLVGAELFGPAAEHLGHLVAWAVARRMTVDEALAMPFYHPVIEEGLRTALRNAASQLDRRAERVRMDFDCSRPGK
ncbi:MAG: dihydrolipoyl dehydrogenase [Deltaproteobacteria bacterium]|nr:MAG: dihydrolipoyl dehydrogenase [Deltaproteobacteria bacterium]